MQIQRAARISGDFADQIEKLSAKDELPIPATEMQLDEGRKPEQVGTYEALLDEKHKKEDLPLPEARMKDYSAKNSPNQGTQGLTEKRLDRASKEAYPHRNPDAWERTGDQRPINALPEELPGSSDKEKKERWEQAYNKSKATKRVLDEDIGKQKTIEASKLNNYVQYKDDPEDAKRRYSSILELDAKLSGIMSKASDENRFLTKEEAEEVLRVKAAKSRMLGIA
jgi:hypothetical protein